MHYDLISNSFVPFNYVNICLQIDGSGRHKLLLDGSLQIIGLYRKDSGIYICTADNGIAQPIQREFQLDVTGKHIEPQIPHSKCSLLPIIYTTSKVVKYNIVHLHDHFISSMKSIS
jgi:hypothetical protein